MGKPFYWWVVTIPTMNCLQYLKTLPACPSKLYMRYQMPDVSVSRTNGVVISNLTFGAFAYALVASPGNFAIAEDAKLPGNAVARVIPETPLTLAEATDYVVFAAGKTTDSSIEPIVVSFPQTAVTSGNVRLRVVHSAASAPTVDEHLTAPADALFAGTVAAT